MQFSQERLDKIAPTSRFRQRTATQNAAEDRQAAGNSGYGGLIVLPDLFSAVNRDLIIALAARYGVPAIYYKRAYAESGSLIAYGDDYAEEFRQAAGYIDRILKGARPQRCLLHCISLVVAQLYGPAARCKRKVMIWR